MKLSLNKNDAQITGNERQCKSGIVGFLFVIFKKIMPLKEQYFL
jgi:hypothetical protein